MSCHNCRNLQRVILLTAVFNLFFSAYSIPQNFKTAYTESWEHLSEKMVISQIESRGIRDSRVIAAMKRTPRHLFVPEKYRDEAYADMPLPIGEGQTISQPYIVALMTELLDLKGNEKVLEIGTGSGYQAAILSQLLDSCYTIEIIKSLAERSKAVLGELGYNNVVVKWGDGYLGWPEKALFDCIIITAAPEEIPPELVRQLKTGGKMVLPVGKLSQDLILLTKEAHGTRKEIITAVRFVPMLHPEKPIIEE